MMRRRAGMENNITLGERERMEEARAVARDLTTCAGLALDQAHEEVAIARALRAASLETRTAKRLSRAEPGR